MSESDAFGDCATRCRKSTTWTTRTVRSLQLYNDWEDFMPKQAALGASATMTIKALQKLQSVLGPAIQELRDKLVAATPEDETKLEWVKAWKAVHAVGDVVATNITNMIMSIVADVKSAEGPGR